MNLEAIALSFLTTLSVPLVTVLAWLLYKFIKMEVKVDTMWNFQMRMAENELLNKGYATKNSPLAISPEALKLLEPIKGELRAFYESHGKNLTDHELELKLEKHFGELLSTLLCIPLKLEVGGCLIIAREFLRNEK